MSFQIQQLQDTSPLAQILGGFGQGVGAAIPQGIDNNILNNILSSQDFQKDPQAYIQSILGANISPTSKTAALSGADQMQRTQDSQQQYQQQAFENAKKQEIALTNTIDQLSSDFGIAPAQTSKIIGDNSDYNTGRAVLEKEKKKYTDAEQAFTKMVKGKNTNTNAERMLTSSLAKKMKTANPQRAREILAENGIEDSIEQAKILSTVSPREKAAIEGVPSMKAANSIFIDNPVEGSELQKSNIKKAAQIIKKVINKDTSPALIIEGLIKKGYSDNDITDIFNTFFDNLTPEQQQEASTFKRPSTLTGKIFKGLSNIFGKSEE